MHPTDEELRKAVALCRYGLIADVLRVPLGSRALHEKAQRTYVIPGSRRTRVAVETMRDWLSLYRNGAFEALYPKTRADRAQPRRLPPEVAELLIALNTEQPALSVKSLIGAARERGVDHPLAPSTAHRLLSREGLLHKRPGEPTPADRRRFAFRNAGELWMSDVMHGPKVRDRRRRRKKPPHRVHRRCHPRHPLRRLRLLGQHHRLPARVQADHRTPGAPHEIVRRQRRQLPLPAARARVRETPHRSAPFPALSTCGEGNNRTLLPHPSRHLARPPQRRGHREPSDVEPHPVGLGRGRAPPPPPPRTQRAHPARPRRARRARRALPRPRHRPRRPLPLRGQTPGHERPNGEPQRTTLRGRRRARRRTRHLALRPPRAACAPHRGRPRRQGRRRRHPPRRLPQPPASSATAPPGSPTAIPHRRSRLPRPWRCDTSSEKP